jgi:hypothetical protein
MGWFRVKRILQQHSDFPPGGGSKARAPFRTMRQRWPHTLTFGGAPLARTIIPHSRGDRAQVRMGSILMPRHTQPRPFTITTQPGSGGRALPADRGLVVLFFAVGLRSCLKLGAYRHNAFGHVTPEGHEQLACQCDDSDATDLAAFVTDSLVEPSAQHAARLVPQPQPCELDHGFAQASIARLRDSLFDVDPATLPRARGQTWVSRHFPSIGEIAIKCLQRQHRGYFWADAPKL